MRHALRNAILLCAAALGIWGAFALGRYVGRVEGAWADVRDVLRAERRGYMRGYLRHWEREERRAFEEPAKVYVVLLEDEQ